MCLHPQGGEQVPASPSPGRLAGGVEPVRPNAFLARQPVSNQRARKPLPPPTRTARARLVRARATASHTKQHPSRVSGGQALDGICSLLESCSKDSADPGRS